MHDVHQNPQWPLRKTGRMHWLHPPRLYTSCETYSTVTVPFMFIAACGVHVKSYLPAATLPKETM